MARSPVTLHTTDTTRDSNIRGLLLILFGTMGIDSAGQGSVKLSYTVSQSQVLPSVSPHMKILDQCAVASYSGGLQKEASRLSSIDAAWEKGFERQRCSVEGQR